MTLPRRILPNKTYLVTRRCTQRMFLLRPTPLNTQIFTYCLAIAAKKTGVLIHAIAVLSNHAHIVCTDPYCRLPEFMTELNKFVAKCVNASLGRWENLWSSEKPSVVTLENSKDVMKRVRYTVCNPVEAGLVAKAEHWPGLLAFLPGQTLRAKRPEVFFSKDGKMEEEAELTLTIPPHFEHMSEQEYITKLREEISDKEAEIQSALEKAGLSFIGTKKIIQQRPDQQPNTSEPRRNLNPQIACQSKWYRIEALQRLKSFLSEYKEALIKWKEGDHDIEFPAGTYAMRVHAKVRCTPFAKPPP